jgi:protein associated with RNAse G/E
LITVKTFKLDGKPHRTWKAELVRQEGPLLVLDGTFASDIEHELLGTIAAGTRSVEYYWMERWYNVFHFSQPNGELRNYYCNISVPPSFDGSILSYVDLDLDILVAPDFSYQTLDVDDFERNCQAYGRSNEIREHAQLASDEVIGMIQARQFPFGNQSSL